MKPLTKKIIDLAFTHLACTQTVDAQAYRRYAQPLASLSLEEMQGLAASLSDSEVRESIELNRLARFKREALFPGAGEEEHRDRASHLSQWAVDGAPIVSMSPNFAAELADSDVEDPDTINWDYDRRSLALEIGGGLIVGAVCLLDKSSCISVQLFGDSAPFSDDRTRVVALFHRVFHALQHRPEGLIVKESSRTPSLETRQALRSARNAGAKVDAGKLYVIGPDLPYQQRIARIAKERMDAQDREDDAAGRPRRKRWWRKMHQRWQAHGAKRALRKSIVIAGHWCGREGDPVVVRARVIEATPKASSSQLRNKSALTLGTSV